MSMWLEVNAPFYLMRGLMNQYEARTFIETGTLEGRTALVATSIFDSVHTIEISPEVYEKKTLLEVARNSKIARHLGNSVDVIPKILAKVSGAVTWWLDGHWSGFGKRYGVECPILDELSLLATRQNDVVFVDDARLFRNPPGPPHRIEDWPAIDQVVAAMKGAVNRHVIQIGDQLIATRDPLIITY